MSYALRSVEAADVNRGYFELLGQLTSAPKPSQEDFTARIELMKAHGVECTVLVDTERDLIVGSITVLVEPKFIRSLAFVAHVEDVVVHQEYQGRRLGQRLVQHALDAAKVRGCYKVILDAAESNGGFYEKCGFYKKEVQYRYDLIS